jgi:hypothetical protein
MNINKKKYLENAATKIIKAYEKYDKLKEFAEKKSINKIKFAK